MDKIMEMRKQFNALVKQLREAQNEAAPDTAKAENIASELRSLSKQIETEEAILRAETGTDPYSPSGEATPVTTNRENEETRAALMRYMRTGDIAELRAITSGKTTGGDTGGYLIPEEWENRILEAERDMFVMRQIADVQKSDTNNNIPVAATVGSSVWIAEGAAYTESDATFATKQMLAYKVGRICKVSDELLHDNAFNLENWLINTFAYTNGLAMEEAYFNGNGTGKPKGALLDAETVTGKTALKIEYDDLLSMFAALKPGYYNNAVWVMNSATLVELMKLKTTGGEYLYKPFDPKLSTEPLGQILGKKVYISSAMPSIAANAKAVAFGDFKYYRIQDRTGFEIKRLDELYAGNGFIGFRGEQRTDGKLLLPEAVKTLTVKAS